jgi:protease I
MNDLNGKRVAILVTDGFEQIEMTSPREALENAGAKCVLTTREKRTGLEIGA